MGATLTVIIAFCMMLLCIPFFILGISLLIIYFYNRAKHNNPSKIMFILSVVSICLCEFLLMPIVILLYWNNFIAFVPNAVIDIAVVLLLVFFLIGALGLIWCFIRSIKKKSVSNKLLFGLSVMFLSGWFIVSVKIFAYFIYKLL